jgi:hypothetical protein
MLGLGGDRGLDALLVFAMTELHQGAFIEANPRDIAILCGLDQRAGRGAEFLSLRMNDKAAQFGLQIEIRVTVILGLRLQLLRQKMHQESHRKLAGRKTHVALTVGIDHVVLARHPSAARAPKADIGARDVLNLDRAMLKDMAHPGAFILAQAAQKAARFAVGTAMAGQPRQGLGETLDEIGADFHRGPIFQYS